VGTNLSQTHITKAQLGSARYDKSTIMPPGVVAE
jgi:hypothetical protein